MPELQVVKRSARVHEAGPLWFLALLPIVLMTAAWACLAAVVWWGWIPAGLGVFLLVMMVRARGTKRFETWEARPKAEPVDAATERRVAAAFERRARA